MHGDNLSIFPDNLKNCTCQLFQEDLFAQFAFPCDKSIQTLVISATTILLDY
jgi:hypothetical protein